MNRRAFLTLLAGGAATVAGGGLFFLFRKRPNRGWLETLVPVDVDVAELKRRLGPEKREFYDAGLLHVQRLRPGFLDDEPAEQARFVASLIESDEFAFHFLKQLAYDAFEIYYASRAGWAAIGYDGPPQFSGFPRFQEAP